MGFMDKAKKLAEQAQEKLDEAQKNFNQRRTRRLAAGRRRAPRYDEHGRPDRRRRRPPRRPRRPSADAAAGSRGADRGARAPRPAAPPPPPSEGGANASPDPFKPIQQ